jgi:hypothetical protein
MESRHVLVSSTYTKCALRAACDAVSRRFTGVAYFPGYEMVTSHFNRGRYFADDLRSVTPEGVDHVMQLFYQHYYGVADRLHVRADTAVEQPSPAGVLAVSQTVNDVLCDEEMLDSEAGV